MGWRECAEIRSSEVRVTSPAHDTTSNHFKPELTVYDFQSIDYSLERFEKKKNCVFTVSAPRTSSLWKALFQHTSSQFLSPSFVFPTHTYEHHQHRHLIDNITAHQATVLTSRASLISLPPPRPTTGKTAIRVQDSLRSRKIHPWEKQIDKTPIMRASPSLAWGNQEQSQHAQSMSQKPC